MKKKTGLLTKAKLLGAGITLFCFIAFVLLAFTIQKIVVTEKTASLKRSVESASLLLSQYDELVKKGAITLDDAKKSFALAIKNLGREGSEGIWIQDSAAKMIVDQKMPELEGQDMSGYRDSQGKQAFADMLRICREQGEGPVQFYFKKPAGDAQGKKYAYVKMFTPWGWMLGAGFYMDDVVQSAGPARGMIFMIMLIFSLAMGGVFFWLARSVSRPINSATRGLTMIGQQVASATRQFSDSSHALAQASSEQAASLEETSSSLEEISSMTRQNADNANQADILMKEANQVINRANRSMGELTKSMSDIARSSQETSKIIKTIDEIAFQTNLLALNAAVEAARAGSAGAGFAVVADEVRSLAMRAAEAAKSTTGMIEATVESIHGGSDLTSRTNQDFNEVASRVSKVAQLVTEIAAASNEQAQGLDQVSKVVTQMDRVTQQNAANAEEYASASQELRSKSEGMQEFIDELGSLIGVTQDLSYARTGYGASGYPEKRRPVNYLSKFTE